MRAWVASFRLVQSGGGQDEHLFSKAWTAMRAHVANFRTGDSEGFKVDIADAADGYRRDRRDGSDRSESGSKRCRRNDTVQQ